MTEYSAKRAEPGVDASRRAFLAASGTALAAATLGDSGARLGRVAPAVPVDALVPLLATADLIAPPGETYLAWHVDPATAPLLADLVRTTTGLDPAQALAGGFVGRRADLAPQFVETAAIPVTGDGAVASADRAVTEWLAATHGAGVERRRVADGVEWRVTAEGWTDVVRLRHVEDWLLVASVGGRSAAQVTPVAAAERYLGLLAERAGATGERRP